MIVFENPQSLRCRFKVTLERQHTSGLMDVELIDARFKNPYNLQVSVPSKLLNYLLKEGPILEFIILWHTIRHPLF